MMQILCYNFVDVLTASLYSQLSHLLIESILVKMASPGFMLMKLLLMG